MLLDEDKPVRAAACEATGATQLRLTLLEGKYHQVKRMIAAVGNRVEALAPQRLRRMAAASRPGPRSVALAARAAAGQAR